MTTNTDIALTPDQRAQHILKVDVRKAELAKLAAKSADLVSITNHAGYQQIHAARMVLKNERVAIEKAGKEARDDATRFSKAVIAAEKELVGLIQPEETRLGEIQQAWDDKVAAEKEERERIEADRLARIRARITALVHLPVAMVGATVEAIDEAMGNAQAFDVTDLSGTDQIEAEAAKATAIEKLTDMRAHRVAADAEAARLAQLQAEIERERDRLAELERVAQARRAEEDRQAAEERRKTAAAEAERLRVEREKADQDAAAERAERKRQQDAEDEERRQRQAAEDEQRRLEEARLAEERAEVERQRQAEAAAKVRREIANATLKGSAAEARLRLIELGDGETVLVAKLTAVLRIDEQEQTA